MRPHLKGMLNLTELIGLHNLNKARPCFNAHDMARSCVFARPRLLAIPIIPMGKAW
jgi:hypothetical protein